MTRRTLLGMLLWGTPALARASASEQPSPRGRVFTPTPELRWPLAAEPGKRIERVRLSVAGREVPARWDERAGVVGRPEVPLKPGEYEASAEVGYDDGSGMEIRWTFAVAPAAPPPPPVSALQQALFKQANAFRRAAGLPPMTLDARLCHAASRHSEYQRRNNVFGHGQNPAHPGYFGASVDERVSACGFGEGCYEGIHFGPETPQGALKSLYHAPYHRLAFLQPGPVAFGVGTVGEITTILAEGTRTEGVVVWPGAGQKDAPTHWEGSEIPNPLRLHHVAGRPQASGVIITFSYFSTGDDRIAVEQAALFGPDGEPVACWFNSPDNDPELTNTAFIIPRQPLRPGATYTASVIAHAKATGAPLSRQWSFTTAAPPKGRSALPSGRRPAIK